MPYGVFGLFRVGEVTHIHLFTFQHLVVLEEALELSQPVLRQLAVMFVGAVLRVVEVDADYLLVALASSTMCIIPIGRALSRLRG